MMLSPRILLYSWYLPSATSPFLGQPCRVRFSLSLRGVEVETVPHSKENEIILTPKIMLDWRAYTCFSFVNIIYARHKVKLPF